METAPSPLQSGGIHVQCIHPHPRGAVAVRHFEKQPMMSSIRDPALRESPRCRLLSLGRTRENADGLLELGRAGHQRNQQLGRESLVRIELNDTRSEYPFRTIS